MSLREEFSILRGKPIALKPRPEDVPCIETSDADKLCKHPVVSVRMITYNHESYIRQAVESVMAQVTDFEYELVIGEDASTDKTREICFELQKKYPDRIRVLWSANNVYDIGGNSIRVLSHCRGEFHALLEGDDFWVDPHKLQKQVDAMRANPSVVLCFGEKQDLEQSTGRVSARKSVGNAYRVGLISKTEFLATECLVPPFTALYRASALKAAYDQFEVFGWVLNLGDLTLWRGLATFGDVYVFHDLFATYRVHGGGVMHMFPIPIEIDAALIRMFYFRASIDTPLSWFLNAAASLSGARIRQISAMAGLKKRYKALCKLLAVPLLSTIIVRFVGFWGVVIALFGFSPEIKIKLQSRMRRWAFGLFRSSVQI